MSGETREMFEGEYRQELNALRVLERARFDDLTRGLAAWNSGNLWLELLLGVERRSAFWGRRSVVQVDCV
jgi:hypothetical protein